jgi:hypothetical protein
MRPSQVEILLKLKTPKTKTKKYFARWEIRRYHEEVKVEKVHGKDFYPELQNQTYKSTMD